MKTNMITEIEALWIMIALIVFMLIIRKMSNGSELILFSFVCLIAIITLIVIAMNGLLLLIAIVVCVYNMKIGLLQNYNRVEN